MLKCIALAELKYIVTTFTVLLRCVLLCKESFKVYNTKLYSEQTIDLKCESMEPVGQ